MAQPVPAWIHSTSLLIARAGLEVRSRGEIGRAVTCMALPVGDGQSRTSTLSPQVARLERTRKASVTDAPSRSFTRGRRFGPAMRKATMTSGVAEQMKSPSWSRMPRGLEALPAFRLPAPGPAARPRS